LGIDSPKSRNPFDAKGSDPIKEGSAAKVLPPVLKKFSQYRLLSASESRKGVKLPR